MKPKLQLEYWRGLLIGSGSDDVCKMFFSFDKRTNRWVTEAYRYRSIMERASLEGLSINDQVRDYESITFSFQKPLTPRREQVEGLHAWIEARGRGVVCLPTGGGKTVLAIMALCEVKRSALIVVPTIDLVRQWHDALVQWLGISVGRLGGGENTITSVTVSTYESALIHADKLGAKFGMLIVDECHHLPGPQNRLIATGSVAPYRLGLSATVERSDGGESIIYELLGEKVYTADIKTMVGGALAPYEIRRVLVELTDGEREQYDASREAYTKFLKQFQINVSRPGGWQEFIAKASRLPGGREAADGHRRQKAIAQKAAGKYEAIWNIVRQHIDERTIIFTDDNEHAYCIGEFLAAPVLTHHTKPKERQEMLDKFRSGKIAILITSKVLNEGVDVPEASVAVVASGSGTVREHVQRLGRILRSSPGKSAVLYEVLAEATSEIFVNKRRREHSAYQKHAAVSP